MDTLLTRAAKGSTLSHAEMDGNLTKTQAGVEAVEDALSTLDGVVVKSINGNPPDSAGNVDVSAGGPGADADLSVGTRTATTLQIANTGGDAVTLPGADNTNAGLLSAAQNVKLNALPTASDLATSFSGKQANLGLADATAYTTDVNAKADARIAAQKATANGLATLGSDGFLTASQIPGGTDNVDTFANVAAFPPTGVADRIYLASNDSTGFWRWNGASYTKISGTPGSTDSVTEGSANLYFTVARVFSSAFTAFTIAATNAKVAIGDTIQVAFQKVQKQLDDLVTAVAGKADIATTTEQSNATTYAISQADNGKQKVFTNANQISVTVPAGLTGFGVVITRGNGAGVVTITGSGTTVRSSTGNGPHALQTANASVSLLSTGTANEYTINGPLGAALIGLPAGGTTGQVATKQSNADGDVVWSAAGAGQSRFPHGCTVYNGSDFLTANAGSLLPYVVTSLVAGSVGEPVPLNSGFVLDDRSGVIRVSNAAGGGGSSGAILRAGSWRLGLGDIHDHAFCFTGTVLAQMQGVFGYTDANTAAIPGNGMFMRVVNGVLRFHIRNTTGAVSADSVGSVNLVLETWYVGYIEELTVNTARFVLKNGTTGALLLDETLTGTLPTGANKEVASTLGMWDSGTAAGTVGLLDLGYYGTKRALPGRTAD